MSQAVVDALQSAYEQFARGEFGLMKTLPDDVEVATAPEMPDAGTYRGEAARSWLNSWVESFDALALELVEIIDVGNRVVVEFVQKGTPRGGSTQVELPTWVVYTVRDDLSVSRLELFMNRAGALEAAGVSE
jgi:ketosteroid isomerase-like protein